MRELLEQGWGSGVIIGIAGIGVFVRLLLAGYYGSLGRACKHFETTGNKTIAYIREDLMKRSERKHEIKNAEGFYLRFFIVCLMNHYLDEANIEYAFSVCKSYDGKGYYNDMAIAWLISVAFVKMRDKTLDFIKEGKLSSFTLNKAISKIRDSFRVSREDKLLLQNFIRKN